MTIRRKRPSFMVLVAGSVVARYANRDKAVAHAATLAGATVDVEYI